MISACSSDRGVPFGRGGTGAGGEPWDRCRRPWRFLGRDLEGLVPGGCTDWAMGLAVPGVLHMGQRGLCLETFLRPPVLGVGLQMGVRGQSLQPWNPSAEDPVGAAFMAEEWRAGNRAGA